MPQSQRLSSVIPFVGIERPACPKCKAPMMLVSVELAGPCVDLHTFVLSAITYLRPWLRMKTL